MSELTLEINFYNDWINIIKDELVHSGYTIDPAKAAEDIELQFFNLQKRRIHSTPRTVYKAKDLTVPKDNEKDFEELSQKIERGDDINPNLSNRMSKPDYKDEMLNDWGIYHIHLIPPVKGHGYRGRKDPLLYAWITSQAVYAISIQLHGAWTDKKLLDKILENWPELLSPYRLSDVDLTYEYDSKEIAKFRKCGVTSFVKLCDNNVYMPPGGGYASDRTSNEVIEVMDVYRRRIRGFEDTVRSSILPNLLESLKEDSKSLPDKLHYQLFIEDNYFYAVEETVKQLVKLAPIDLHSQ
jgi:hypothetical protein